MNKALRFVIKHIDNIILFICFISILSYVTSICFKYIIYKEGTTLFTDCLTILGIVLSILGVYCSFKSIITNHKLKNNIILSDELTDLKSLIPKLIEIKNKIN